MALIKPHHMDLDVAARKAREVAGGLILADLVMVVVHIFQWATGYASRGFYLGDDRGLGEQLQYAKLLGLLGLLALIFLRLRRPLYVALILIFGYLLFDDAYMLHEKVGYFLAKRFEITSAFGLRNVDFGELIVSSVVGSFLIAQLGLVYWVSGPRERRVGRTFVGLLILLAVCGVGFDMLHVMMGSEGDTLEVLEDGGEMFAVSLMVAYATYLYWGGASETEESTGELTTDVAGRGKPAIRP